MLGIKLQQLIYIPCHTSQTYGEIISFFQKNKYFLGDSQNNLKDIIQYNEKFQFITYTMDRSYQSSLTEYLQYIQRKNKSLDKQLLDKAFDEFITQIQNSQFLEIDYFDTEKAWVTVNDKKQIQFFYYLNFTKKIQQKSQIEVEINQILLKAGQHLTKKKKHKNESMMQTILQIPSQISLLKKATDFGIKKVYGKRKQIIKQFFKEEFDRNLSKSFKDKVLSITILNIVLSKLLQSQQPQTLESYQIIFQKVQKKYYENFQLNCDNLFSLLDKYSIKCKHLEVDKEFTKLLQNATQNASQIQQRIDNEHLDFLLIKLLQKHDAMNQIYSLKYHVKLKDIFITHFQNIVKKIVIGKLNGPCKLNQLVSYMALLRYDDDDQLIKLHFQLILNSLTQELKIDSITHNGKQFKIFTDAEIEKYLIDLQVNKIKDAQPYPDLITDGIFIDHFKASEFYNQRKQFFVNILLLLENTLNVPSEELAEITSINLLQCLNENITEESKLVNDLLSLVIKHYLKEMIDMTN